MVETLPPHGEDRHGSFATPQRQLDPEARPRAKRRRIAVACGNCRARKSKCDGLRPACSVCVEQGLVCIYDSTRPLQTSDVPQDPASFYLPRIANVERLLQNLTGRVDGIQRHISLDPAFNASQTHPTPVSNDADAFHQDAVHQDPSDGIGSIAFRNEQESGFFGPSSNIAFTRCIVRAITTILNRKQSSGAQLHTIENNHVRSLPLVSRPQSPCRQSLGIPAISIEAESPFCVPPKEDTSALIDRYFDSTGALFPFIHRATFMETYHTAVSTNFASVQRTWLGLLYMILAMATSTTLDDNLGETQRNANSDVFYQRARAVCERNVRIGNSLENVQLLLLMSQYLQGTSRSIETWGVHGLAVKAAYQLGIHSKNALQAFSPLEREYRSRTWFGCVILDRSLSMTLGRPAMIPENHVKLSLPRALANEAYPPPESTNPTPVPLDDSDVQLFSSTISLYKILQEVLTVLYGDNLGCDPSPAVYETASQALQCEHKLLAWQHDLPASLSLVKKADICSHQSQQNFISRFHVVLTLRFLSVRILVHRPVLQEFLSVIEGPEADRQRQYSILRGIGSSSLSMAIESAIDVVEILAEIICVDNGARYLLGAWWFCSFYVFNAALVIYSGLLVQSELEDGHERPIIERPADRRLLLFRAVECLRKLEKGNGVARKCADYLSTLIHILDTLYPPDGQADHFYGGTSADAAVHLSAAIQCSRHTDQEPNWFSMDLTQLMDPADLDFWNTDFAA